MREFTAQEKEHRAQEAKRLLSEPLFKEYFQSRRDTALEELATIDPNDVTGIIKQQAIAQVALDYSDFLVTVVAEGGSMDGGNEAPA